MEEAVLRCSASPPTEGDDSVREASRRPNGQSDNAQSAHLSSAAMNSALSFPLNAATPRYT